LVGLMAAICQSHTAGIHPMSGQFLVVDEANFAVKSEKYSLKYACLNISNRGTIGKL